MHSVQGRYRAAAFAVSRLESHRHNVDLSRLNDGDSQVYQQQNLSLTLSLTLNLIYIIKGVMFVCLSVCIYVPYGRPNGWADRDQT